MRTRGINLTQGMEFRDKISRSLKFYGGWFSVLFVIAGRNPHAVTFSKWNIETTTGNMIYNEKLWHKYKFSNNWINFKIKFVRVGGFNLYLLYRSYKNFSYDGIHESIFQSLNDWHNRYVQKFSSNSFGKMIW